MQNLSPDAALTLINASQAQTPSLPDVAKFQSKQDLDEIAKEFEAVFLSEMVKPMFEGIETSDSMFGGGKGEEIFQGMMLNEYGEAIAEKDITGIQTLVKNKLIEMQAERTAQNADKTQSAAVEQPVKRGIIDADYVEYPTTNTRD